MLTSMLPEVRSQCICILRRPIQPRYNEFSAVECPPAGGLICTSGRPMTFEVIDPILESSAPTNPPSWAVLERALIDAIDAAAPIFLEKYTRPGGALIWQEEYPGDGVWADDLYEAFFNWPFYHALGGRKRIDSRRRRRPPRRPSARTLDTRRTRASPRATGVAARPEEPRAGERHRRCACATPLRQRRWRHGRWQGR